MDRINLWLLFALHNECVGHYPRPLGLTSPHFNLKRGAKLELVVGPRLPKASELPSKLSPLAPVVSHVSEIGLNWSKWANLGGKEGHTQFQAFLGKPRRQAKCALHPLWRNLPYTP